jgi:hypothetical protein
MFVDVYAVDVCMFVYTLTCVCVCVCVCVGLPTCEDNWESTSITHRH